MWDIHELEIAKFIHQYHNNILPAINYNTWSNCSNYFLPRFSSNSTIKAIKHQSFLRGQNSGLKNILYDKFTATTKNF